MQEQETRRDRRKPKVPVYGPPPGTIRRRIGLVTMRGASGEGTIAHPVHRLSDDEIARPGSW